MIKAKINLAKHNLHNLLDINSIRRIYLDHHQDFCEYPWFEIVFEDLFVSYITVLIMQDEYENAVTSLM